MGRRRKHDGDSGLASDHIPGQNQNNISTRPCHFLLYRHQAFRGDTRIDCIARPEKMQAKNQPSTPLRTNLISRRIGDRSL
jgi:hypothetical protein